MTMPFASTTELLFDKVIIHGYEAQSVFKITVGRLQRSELRDVEGQGINRPFGLFRPKTTKNEKK